MAVRGVLIFVAFAALAIASEVDEGEQKKRGAGKTTSLNAIPTGAQKPEYTYSIYSQSPSQNSPSSPSYQQTQSSFYPNQASQYYSSGNPQPEAQSPYSPQSPYAPQPQLNFVPQQTQSQFVPLNFIPNPGYQPRIHIVPSKSANGNIQLAIIQQPSGYQPSVVPYSNPLFSPNAQVNQHHLFNSLPQQYNVAPNYQPYQLGNPYLGQQSSYLFGQPNPSLYNNLVYQNPVQSLYNYYPSQSQAKYSLSYGPQVSNEGQGPTSQSVSKDDNDVAHSNDYITPADTSSYKNSYTASRGSSYSKL